MPDLVTNIQGYSIHDGPGIRTVVFLKGCGLECQWCSNPECISLQPEVGFFKSLCTKCGECADICPYGALIYEAGELPRIDRELCTGCGACSSVCFYKAIVLYGESMDAEEIFDAVNRDAMFYQASGGGVTVSGGEALMHPQLVCDLFEKCRQAGIHTCIETSGYAAESALRQVIPYTDYILYDLKIMNSEKHRQYTGKPNDLILDNAKIAATSGIETLFRMPLIPGINDDLQNIRETADFLHEFGDNFNTFEDLYEAFKKQTRYIVNRVLWLGTLAQSVEPQYLRFPFNSCITGPTCMEKGQDILITDSDHSYGISDRAIVDTADSLTAIKKLVFDEKKLTMNEIMSALDTNFEDKRGEEIRQMCLAVPKFGNDIDEADLMVRDVGTFSGSVIMSYKNPFDVPCKISREGLSWHFFGGLGVGALADGRKSKEPLNDGSLSPMRGMDKLGPTGVMRSVIKAGFKGSYASCLNQKFSATVMQSPESREKLAKLTDTFFRNGGQHIQYNLVDTEELLDAKVHPEKHRDLVVRVGGFSAYFVMLSPEIQDDIIYRSTQGC